MLYLVIGDPHYSSENKYETDVLEKEVDRLIKLAKPDKIVILGDLLHKHNLSAQCRAISWLYHLADCRPTIVLVGNHDRRHNQDYMSDIHPFTGIRNNKRLIIVDKSVLIDEALFIPYVPNERFVDAIVECENADKGKVIFAHQALHGCGVAVDELWEIDTKVISGHIHDRMMINCGKRVYDLDECNLYYPGAPLQHTFADEDIRYCCVVDVADTMKIEEYVLEVPKKMVITMKYPIDVDKINQASRYTRFDIIGSMEECEEIKKMNCVKEAQNRGVVFKFPRIEIVTVDKPILSKMTFVESIKVDVIEECGENGIKIIDQIIDMIK